MAIQRAIVKGLLFDLVQTRSMFTAEVIPVGGDTAEILWDAYLNSIYDPIEGSLTTFATFTTRELQTYSAGSWVTFDEAAFAHAGTGGTDFVANFVSAVLIGKGLGKHAMGRKFIGGLLEGVVHGNALDPVTIAPFVLALAAYITPFTGIGGGTITPGILDKTGSFKPFIGGYVSAFLGTMRRRKPGMGM